MKRRAALAVLTLLASTAGGAAQSSPFAGVWVSDTTPSLVWTVEQSPSEVSQRITVKERELRTNRWVLHGPPVSVPNAAVGATAEISASAVGQSLVFHGPIALPAGLAAFHQTWALDDRDRLVVSTKVESPGTTFSRQETFSRRH